jgi:serine/threonine-protein kinase HipA
MTSKAYIFIDGLEQVPIICAVTEIDERLGIGRFRYGKSYLARNDAFALDPIHLPLNDKEHTTTFNRGLFGVLSDAGADSWGKKVILSIHNTKPKNALEFLLAGSGMGAGCLVFSLSRSASKFKSNKNTLGDLPMLLQAKDAILNNQDIAPEAKLAFEYGSSMGGARPKTIVVDGQHSYLAKFNRPDDIVNMVKVEHATMRMLNELLCCVAPTKTVHTASGDVLLVERFDTLNNVPHSHFLSAYSVFSANKVSDSSLQSDYSYGRLAEFIMAYGAQAQDAHDLYYRMVFNALIGNTDDHARNHAFTYNFAQAQWRLAPAYDVVPINNSRLHGIGLGDMGRLGTVENMLSQSKRFGIKTFKAKKIINEVKDLVAQWPSFFASHGVDDADVERLKGIIPAT